MLTAKILTILTSCFRWKKKRVGPLFLSMPQAKFRGGAAVHVRVVRAGTDGKDATDIAVPFLGAMR